MNRIDATNRIRIVPTMQGEGRGDYTVLPDSHSGTTITNLMDMADATLDAATSRESIGPFPTVDQAVRELMNKSWEARNRLVEPPIRVNGGDLR